jgi:Arc/MetJ family transcription regulator
MDIEIEVDIDDDLLAAAQKYTGLTDVQAVVTAALKALVEREAQRSARRDASES